MDTSETAGNANVRSIDTIITRIEKEIMQYSDPLAFLIPSRLPKKDLWSIEKEIEKDLTKYIIENIDKKEKEGLNLEIDRLGFYKSKYDLNKILESYSAFKLIIPDNLPESEKIRCILDNSAKYISNLGAKIQASQRIADTGIKLKDDIDDCLRESASFVNDTYDMINEWADVVDQKRELLFIEGKDYKTSIDELFSKLQDETPSEIFNEKIKNQNQEIFSLYEDRLKSKSDRFEYVYAEIQRTHRFGLPIGGFREMKQIFDNYYKNSAIDENIPEEKLSEENQEEQVKFEAGNYQKKFNAFYEGMLFYNVETKKKNDLISSFDRINCEHSEKLKKISLQYKDQLKDNDFYSNLEDYMADYGITDWMAVMESIK